MYELDSAIVLNILKNHVGHLMYLHLFEMRNFGLKLDHMILTEEETVSTYGIPFQDLI